MNDKNTCKHVSVSGWIFIYNLTLLVIHTEEVDKLVRYCDKPGSSSWSQHQSENSDELS